MTTRDDAIEYVFYIIEHQILNNIQGMFAQRNIFVDQDFIDRIIEVYRMFEKITNIYTDNNTPITVFINFIKQHLYTNQEPIIPQDYNTYLFTHFYVSVVALVNSLTSDVYTSVDRLSVIEQSLQLPNITHIVYKYDYYFRGKHRLTIDRRYSGDAFEETPDQEPEEDRVSEFYMHMLPHNRIISGSIDTPPEIWNYKTGSFEGILQGHRYDIKEIIVNDDILVSIGNDKSIGVWDIHTLENKHLINTFQFIKQAVVLKNMIITCSWSNNYLYVWDLNTGQHIRDIDMSTYILSLWKLSDTKIVVSGGGVFRVWDITTDTADLNVDIGHDRIWVLGQSIVSASMNGVLRIFSLNNTVQTISGFYSPQIGGIVFLKKFPDDSGRVIIGVGNGSLHVWNLYTQTYQFTIDSESNYAFRNNQIVFLPNGHIAVGLDYGMIKIWDPRTQKNVLTFKAHQTVVEALLILPDGLLASVALDNQIKIWK